MLPASLCCPQAHEKVTEDTHKSIDIYSALRDPKTGIVRLFLEYFPVHPFDKPEDQHDPAPGDVFKGCVFSNFRNFSDKFEVPAEEVSQRRQLLLDNTYA